MYRTKSGLLLFGGNGNGAESSSGNPNDATDEEYFHYLDFSDSDRFVEASSTYTEMWTQKDKKLNADLVKWSSAVAVAPIAYSSHGVDISGDGKDNALIGTAQNRRTVLASSIADSYHFQYTDFTVICNFRTTLAVSGQGFLLSDYGDTAQKLFYVKVGNGTSRVIQAYLRDTSSNAVNAITSTAMDANVLVMIVARFTGSEKKAEVWLNGSSYGTDTNASYIASTTWEGEHAGGAIPTVGVLSNSLGSPCTGYLGEMYIAKQALSNARINQIANYIVSKWNMSGWSDIT